MLMVRIMCAEGQYWHYLCLYLAKAIVKKIINYVNNTSSLEWKDVCPFLGLRVHRIVVIFEPMGRR